MQWNSQGCAKETPYKSWTSTCTHSTFSWKNSLGRVQRKPSAKANTLVPGRDLCGLLIPPDFVELFFCTFIIRNTVHKRGFPDERFPRLLIQSPDTYVRTIHTKDNTKVQIVRNFMYISVMYKILYTDKEIKFTISRRSSCHSIYKTKEEIE